MAGQQCECTKHYWIGPLQMVTMVNFMLFIFYHNKEKKKKNRKKKKKREGICPSTLVGKKHTFFQSPKKFAK